MLRFDHRVEILLRVIFLAACALIYGWWAFNLPIAPWGEPHPFVERFGPDENMRIDLLQWIVSHGALPLGTESELVDNGWGFSYGLTVYGSTLLALPAAQVASALGGGLAAITLAARLTNVALSVAALALFFLIANRFFSLAPTRFLFVALIAFLPQYAFLSSYFNCEVLEIFSVALAALWLIRGVEQRWRFQECIGLGIALGICALSYYFAYAMYPVSIIVYFWTMARQRRHGDGSTAVRDYVARPLVIVAVAFALCGWFFIRNLVLHGDFFGMRALSESGELNAIDELKPSNRVTPKSLGIDPLTMMVSGSISGESPWLIEVFKSTIGNFGMMTTPLGRWEYAAYAVLLTIGFAAGAVRLVNAAVTGRNQPPVMGPLVVSLIVIIVVTGALAVYYSYATDYQAQGRYIIAAMPAVMFIVAYGYGGGVRSAQATPQSISAPEERVNGSRIASTIVLGLWLLAFCWVFATVIVPFATAPLFG